MSTAAGIHAKVNTLGKLTLRMTSKAGSGHPSSGLSLAHIVAELLYRQMRWDPANPYHPRADRLVLSEGHAVPVVYAALADLGAAVGKSADDLQRLEPDDVDGLRAEKSLLDGHPNPAEGVPFFDAATGSLGQGLSVAAGLALAARHEQSPRRVFVIIGDGESREGQIWEAVDFIADYRLTNICAIFNCNGEGQSGHVSEQQTAERQASKLKAFGWEVVSVDGHSPDELSAAFDRFGKTERPLAIVARTVKGWGVDELRKGNWHGKPLPEKDLDAAYASLDAATAKHSGGATALGRPPAPSAGAGPKHPSPLTGTWPDFDAAMESGGFGAALEKGKLATRRAYGAALKVAGDLLPQVVVLDGDVSNSTFSEVFRDAHPDRFHECKIAEQNMISVAAGLSAAGYIPFANSFAKFLSRGMDQIEMANISRANLKLVGSHAGVTLAADGPSQMGVVDVAFFSAFTAVRGDDRKNPICLYFQPADAVATYHCTRRMVEFEGMCYMRTHRPDVELIYSADSVFEPGGFNVLETGEDVALVASGYMVHECRKVVGLLGKQGIRATLIDAYTLPIDAGKLRDALARAGGAAVVVEDNYGAGLGAAVAQIAATTGGLRVAGLCCQRIPKSTRSTDEALAYVGLSAPQIADHALAFLKQAR